MPYVIFHGPLWRTYRCRCKEPATYVADHQGSVDSIKSCEQHIGMELYRARQQGAANMLLLDTIVPTEITPQPVTVSTVDGQSVTFADFEAMVEAAFASIEEELSDVVRRVTVSVAYDCTASQLRAAGHDPQRARLLGLYGDWPAPHVLIFYKPTVQNTPSAELTERVRNILLHELGHSVGLPHSELEQLGV